MKFHARTLPTFLGTFALFILSCTGARKIVNSPTDATPPDLEVRNLDTLVVTPTEQQNEIEIANTRPIYRATQKRDIDLLHTKLDLKFDWPNQSVLGKASLTLVPYFEPIDQVVLDAKGFEIHNVTLLNTGTNVDYEYNGDFLAIELDRVYKKDQQIGLYIDYTAHPSEGESGSQAITSDKGLFFINPLGEDGSKPQQIWTQGETQFNSRWFPTSDQPNERCTQELILTVEDRYKTLSNGVLTKSITNPDGTRSDYWELMQPHAPYLFMVAVGEFAVVSDKWQDINVDYYVEADFEADAKEIFANTPEMITFFSNITGVDYPWNKYAQVVVRDYVSGAMENTTAVIFGEFVQKHTRSLIDNDNDYIVAHELFHHWFGDYVTCESWSNLTLNEGFANYAEYLWFEHKYGLDRAASHRIQEIEGYMFQAAENMHPLIHFDYVDKEDMFDQHSYNKGGLVLHMLRHYLGDEAFFAGLNLYLKDNALSSVEVHHLRLAFEEISGEDLNWFFNQWYLSSGHPVINMDYEWDTTGKNLVVHVDQVQDPASNPPIFKIPTSLDIYHQDGTRERFSIEINQRSQQLTIPLVEAPALVVIDPDRVQLAIINCAYDQSDYQRMYNYNAALEIRIEALSKLGNTSDTVSQTIIESALSDPFWTVRRQALGMIDWKNQPDLQSKLIEMATYDSHSLVRADAIYALGSLKLAKHKDFVARGINMHDAYPVVAASIRTLHELDAEMCEDRIGVLKDDDHPEIVAALSSIYSLTEDTTYLVYFAKHMSSVEGLPALDFYQNFEGLLVNLDEDQQAKWLIKSRDVAIDQTISPYTRIAATRMIISASKGVKKEGDLANKLQVFILEIMEKEKNDQVRSIYQNFLDS